jgi:hypothetical protein
MAYGRKDNGESKRGSNKTEKNLIDATRIVINRLIGSKR